MGYKVQKPCKVCGKSYTPCYDCENDNVAFHWRTVACSRECAEKYFTMVLEARRQPSDTVIEETVTEKEITDNIAEDNAHEVDVPKILPYKPARKKSKESEQIE